MDRVGVGDPKWRPLPQASMEFDAIIQAEEVGFILESDGVRENEEEEG